MSKKCIGCGRILQDKDALLNAYTPNIKNDYCQRCFRLKNYGEEKEDIIDSNLIIKKVNKKKGLVFFFIDFLNINNESISLYNKINLSKVLVISKCDTLRKEMKWIKIETWLKKVYNINDKIIFTSGKKFYTSCNFIDFMNNKSFKTCFLMGLTNAGKSTYLNNILNKYNIDKRVLVSKKANTTLDFIKFKINDYILYDTPGLTIKGYNNMLTKSIIKPITLNITKPTMLIINKNIKFIFKDNNSITFYVNNIDIKKVFTLEDLDNIVSINDNEDYIISGLGFVNVKKKTKFYTNLEEKETRKNISGINYE